MKEKMIKKKSNLVILSDEENKNQKEKAKIQKTGSKLNLIGKNPSKNAVDKPEPTKKQSRKTSKAEKNKVLVSETVAAPVSKAIDNDDSDLDEQIETEKRIGPDALKISREDIHRILLKYSLNGIIDIDGALEESREKNKANNPSIETDY